MTSGSASLTDLGLDAHKGPVCGRTRESKAMPTSGTKADRRVKAARPVKDGCPHCPHCAAVERGAEARLCECPCGPTSGLTLTPRRTSTLRMLNVGQAKSLFARLGCCVRPVQPTTTARAAGAYQRAAVPCNQGRWSRREEGRTSHCTAQQGCVATASVCRKCSSGASCPHPRGGMDASVAAKQAQRYGLQTPAGCVQRVPRIRRPCRVHAPRGSSSCRWMPQVRVRQLCSMVCLSPRGNDGPERLHDLWEQYLTRVRKKEKKSAAASTIQRAWRRFTSTRT